MDYLKKIADEIRGLLKQKRSEYGLSFEEADHIYCMKDVNGVERFDFPSVSKIMKKFYPEIDSQALASRVAKGDLDETNRLLEAWSKSASFASNLGNRTHFLLEKRILDCFGIEKDLRQPNFDCDELQIKRSNQMVAAGDDFIALMMNRGGVLLDTEVVMGCPNLGFVGQADKFWIMENKGDIGIVCTDWKTNKPEKFVEMPYHKPMFPPFDDLLDYDLNHYYIQLSLYGKLLSSMLKNTKFDNIKFFGSVVVHLKDDGTFQEYKVPKKIKDRIFEMEIKKYLLDF